MSVLDANFLYQFCGILSTLLLFESTAFRNIKSFLNPTDSGILLFIRFVVVTNFDHDAKQKTRSAASRHGQRREWASGSSTRTRPADATPSEGRCERTSRAPSRADPTVPSGPDRRPAPVRAAAGARGGGRRLLAKIVILGELLAIKNRNPLSSAS